MAEGKASPPHASVMPLIQRPGGRPLLRGARHRGSPSLLLPILALSFLALTACSESPQSAQETEASEAAEAIRTGPRSAEFVILIDNSRSITAQEQVLVRETTMLLADLLDRGDRVSVITFGQDAKIVANRRINSVHDLEALKDAVRRGVDFGENYSDIRRGLRTLAENRQNLFPMPDALHSVILLTDGRLEPADGQTETAFQQILKDVNGPLKGLELYCVLLGETSSSKVISGLGTTGHELIAEHVARSREYFYHAKKLDQLLDAAVFILNKTKGISSLGEEGGVSFRIDGTVKSMTLIVRKRSLNGTVYAESQDIKLSPPDEKAGTDLGAESVYRNDDYTYFDLFVVRNPRVGLWRVSLAGGGRPMVLSKIVTPIRLVVDARDRYYVNERTTLRAWLADDEKREISREPYRLRAHLAMEGGLQPSEVYVPMTPDTQTGQYYLEAPGALMKALRVEEQASSVDLEVIAQLGTGQGDANTDPWFLRRSHRMTIELLDPLITWSTAGGTQRRIPALKSHFELGGTLDTDNPFYAEFEVPPVLTLVMERFNDKEQRFEEVWSETVPYVAENNTLAYRIPGTLEDYGSYRYGYLLKGQTREGDFSIQSPWFGIAVVPPWDLIGASVLVLVAMVHIVGAATARVRGRAEMDVDGLPETYPVRPRRVFDSMRDFGPEAKEAVEPARFRLTALKWLGVAKKVRLEMVAGDATFDGREIRQGMSIRIRPPRGQVLQLRHPEKYAALRLWLKV
jgi:hypothetical protein